MLFLSAVVAVGPERRSSLDLSMFPCSFDEIHEGIRNWASHLEYAEFCVHLPSERFRQQCLMLYWNRFD